MMNFLAGLQSIPDELYEAAEINSASAFQSFRHVALRERSHRGDPALHRRTWDQLRFVYIAAVPPT